MELKKIKILINSNGTYLDTILPPITANENGRTIVQVIAPFPITDIVSVNYSIRPIQATVKGSYLVPTGKFGKDVLADDYTHFQTVADWNVFEIPINAVALEYISKYRAGLVLASFTIKQLQMPYFATNYLGLFSDTNPIPTTTYNDGDYFIANEYNFTAHDITWAKGDYAYFYNVKWNKGKSVLRASTPSIELPVDPSLKDAPQLEYDEDVALLLAQDLGLLTQRVSQAETDIESAETDIYNLESDVGNLQSDKADKTELVPINNELLRLEQDKVDKTSIVDNLTTNDATKVLSAKQGKVLQDTKEALSNKAQDFTTINETLYPSVQATKTELDKKVDKILTIIGLDLQDNILIGEFRTALGNATQSVAGLLSAEDKTHLDGLVALLETSDGNNVVDTIGEILDIFQNYPEGANILEALNGKVDKIAGKQLSTNDLTNALKGYYDTAYAHSQIKDKSNPHNTSFANITDKPTTRDGFGITDVYTKPETYTQQEINALFDNLSAVKGLKSTLLTPTELSNGDTISTNLLTNNGAYIVFTATDTSTKEIDSDTVPVSTIKTGKKFVFFDNQEIVFTIGETNSTFETSEDITLKINLLYLDDENVQAISVDFDGSLTNYLLSQTNVQEAIEKIDNELKTTNDNLSNHTNNINNPHSVTKTQIGLGNVNNTSDLDKPISTAQQTALNNKVNVTRKIANIDLQDDITKQELKVALDVDDIETANMIKSITRSGSNLFTITYYDDTTSSLLTLAELKSFIGEATQSLSGLMSAQDKTDLDTLMALFDSDGDSVVNTIQEILDIFENYPEGADLVTALAGKVDKTLIVDNVTTNDATKVLSAKQGKELNDTVALKVNTSDIVNNLTSIDTNKPLSANQGRVLRDTKEATANKAIDFSVVNDTKYPTTKAVKDLVDTMMGDIDSILDIILGV